VAVILSPEDLAELEETLSVLSDPQALADIREADAAYASRDVIRGVDAVRALRSVNEGTYELVITPPATRALRSGLPESVAAAGDRVPDRRLAPHRSPR
jgi:hypothetical protein